MVGFGHITQIFFTQISLQQEFKFPKLIFLFTYLQQYFIRTEFRTSLYPSLLQQHSTAYFSPITNTATQRCEVFISLLTPASHSDSPLSPLLQARSCMHNLSWPQLRLTTRAPCRAACSGNPCLPWFVGVFVGLHLLSYDSQLFL